MKRRDFIYKSSLSIAALGAVKPMTMNYLNSLPEKGEKMPVLFLGHGSPMNAVEENIYTKGWSEITKDIPRPEAILIISAHWETRGGTQIFAGEKPKMIYDMYGFPQNLYQVQYPAEGNPDLANEIVSKIDHNKIAPTHKWGLDHGAWSVLVKMYPDASIPCFQMSLNYTRDMQWHYDLAKQLSFLRKRGVLILGSGNIVHNLRYLVQFHSDPAPEWALDFDDYVVRRIKEGDHKALVNYKNSGEAGLVSVNSAEHYIPMLYTMALKEDDDEVIYFNHDVGKTLMDVSMRCIKIG